MENKNIEIFASVVYKEHMAKSLDGKVGFEAIKAHVQALVNLVSELGQKQAVPFNNPPARGVKAVGDPCKNCSTPLIEGKKGPYCKPCYLKWKDANPS